MAEVKGVQLKGSLDFLRARFGEEAVNEAMSKLPAEDRVLLPAVMLDSNWYPYDVWRAVRHLSALLIPKGESGTDFPYQLGRHMARYAFTGVYETFLEYSPAKQVAKFAWIKDFFSKDARRVEAQMLDDHSCQVRYIYEAGAVPTRSTCLSNMGFWDETLEMAGAEKVTSEHRNCVLDGGESCDFHFTWK